MGYKQTPSHKNGKGSFHQIGLVRGQFGNVPEAKWVPFLQEAGFDGVISLELEYAPHPDRIVEWATEAYEQTAAMMDQLGVRAPAAEKKPASVT